MATEPLWELVDESLDEAAFLWQRWEGELTSLTRSLDETWTWTEDRLHGALDGVRAAGDRLAPRLAGEQGLASDNPVRRTIAAHLLAAASPIACRAVLGDAVREADESRLWSLIRGIETATLDGTFVPVASILANGSPLHRAALCRLKAFRRAAPGREVVDAFASNLPSLQVHALRAARYSSDPQHTKLIEGALASDDLTVKRTAIECGVELGMPAAWSAAVGLAQQLRPESGALLSLVALLGGEAEHQIVIAALRKPQLQPLGLFAVGYLGTARAAETCIAGMSNPKLARMAGEAYCAITGADLERDHLAADEPEEAEGPIPFADDDLQANLVPSPEELWPLPDLEAVRKHWSKVSSGFAAGRCYRGASWNLATLVAAVENGPMLRRPDIIRRLSAHTAGRYDVEPRAFADPQRRMMMSGRGAFPGPAR